MCHCVSHNIKAVGVNKQNLRSSCNVTSIVQRLLYCQSRQQVTLVSDIATVLLKQSQGHVSAI